MKQQTFIDLIETSQAVIKNELLPNSSDKYNLLMLMKSFELVKNYILEQENYAENVNKILQPALDMPFVDNQKALTLLSQNIRDGKQIPNLFSILESLNDEALKITDPKAAKHD
ncbi:hypothetical protein [uncultured Psychrobacter sp.]|uniref:hypothetical protein n=1 Tax=uncultured Psychrobacter sp. TaxID=259303 RepID=UPI00261C2867|nr:hypothetical protein [uncultured Psychrobacter sp.]